MDKSNGITRRTFISAAAATTAIAALSTAGCSPSQNAVAEGDSSSASNEGWVSAACWHNCGGRCINMALVQDGVVIRQKTDDSHEDSWEQFQQRGCVRGRAQRDQVFSADRIRKPLKRSGWAPGGGENSQGQLRGMDTWEEIEWDEALDLIAQELERVTTEYDNRSILCMGGDAGTLLSAYGGYVPRWGTTSYGAWAFSPGPIGFFNAVLDDTANDRLDFQNCETVVLLGSNPAWSSAGSPIYHAIMNKEKGVKFIGIDPLYNESYAAMEAEWVPSYPGCDTAICVGLAYEMLRMDPEKQLIDWDFLNSHTLGFDAEHMPDGEDPAGNFKDYLLGTYDGVPKDPAWASKRTGIAPEKFTYIAELIGKDHAAAILSSYCVGRNQQADNVPQAMMTLGSMGGHFGKKGHMCGLTTHSSAFSGGPSIFNPGSNGLEKVENPVTEDCFCDAELWRGVVSGSYTWTGNSTRARVPGVKKDIDIRIIWHSGNARLQTADDQNTGIEAHRKVDLVISNASFMTTNSKYSDFILPVSTPWERPGGFLTGNREMLIMYTQVVDRYYETYSDQEIAKMLAPKLGIDADALFPISEMQQFYNQAAGATMIDENGEEATLISFTQEEIDSLGVDGEPQDGYISFTEFKEKGVVSVARADDDAYYHIAAKAFVEDPVANPMPSESGLFEIYCRKLASECAGFGWSTDVTPIPAVYYGPEGIAGTFANGDIDAGVPSAYPFHLYNPHYLRRSHTVFDNVQWLREAWTNPVYLNSSDAAAKGVVTGDTVMVTSPHGSTLRDACVTERLAPGVVGLPHGAWVDVDESTGIDYAGSDNYLTGTNCTGAGVSGWNSVICTFEKYSEELTPDVDLPLLVEYDADGVYVGGGRR